MKRSVLTAAVAAVALTAAAFGQSEPVTYDSLIDAARASMMANPGEALASAQAAETQAESRNGVVNQNERIATALWLQAEALTRLGQARDAMPLVDRGLALLGEAPQASQLHADLLVARGRVAKDAGDFALALISMRQAYEIYAEIGALRSQSIVLQSIGSIYSAGRQYENAIAYFVDAAERFDDPSLRLAASNNIANAYREIGRYEAATSAFQTALDIAEAMGGAVLQARILNNRAALHVAFGEIERAEADIAQAFDLLADPRAGEWSRFLYGVRAQTALARGELAQARTDIERTFDGVTLTYSTQPFADFHETASEIYQNLGESELALEHFRAFKRLEDDARDVAASVNTALLAAEFEFAEQELEIQRLRSEGLEQDLALAEARGRTRLIGGGALASLFLLALIVGAIRYRASRERQRLLAKALYTDAATGLPSASALANELDEALEQDREVALIVLSIERQAALNGALGFGTFAQLSRQLADRLAEDAAVEQTALIAPGVLGVMIDYAAQDALLDEDLIAETALRLLERLRAPFQVDGAAIDLTATAGGVVYAGADSFKQAMIAVEQARERHAPFSHFDAARYGDPEGNLALMSRMVAAINDGEMELHYQPKLNLRTGQYEAAEALARWNDPERGPIPPASFVPLAEETGHIRELSEWALKRAVRDQLALSKAGHDLAISINISGALLCDTEFAAVASRLATQAPGQLIFEVTETALVRDTEKAARTMEQWARVGVRLAIDDYGVGHSSLAYLKGLPVHELKLDRHFLQGFAESQRDRLVVRSTVDLSHTLGLHCTVEGVEDASLIPALQAIGADWAQGFGLARPMALLDLVGLLQRQAAGEDTFQTQPRPATPDLRGA